MPAGIVGPLRRGLMLLLPPAPPSRGALLDRVLDGQALADRPPVEPVDGGDLPIPRGALHARSRRVPAPPVLVGSPVLVGRVPPARATTVAPQEAQPAAQVVGDRP